MTGSLPALHSWVAFIHQTFLQYLLCTRRWCQDGHEEGPLFTFSELRELREGPSHCDTISGRDLVILKPGLVQQGGGGQGGSLRAGLVESSG